MVETVVNNKVESDANQQKETSGEEICENGDTSPQMNKKTRPTPESVAMDRGVQNIARKAHKNSKGDDKKLGTIQ